MPDPSLLTPLALVHPYRHKPPNHATSPPSTAGEGTGSGTGVGSESFEEEENMRRKQREAFSVPDV